MRPNRLDFHWRTLWIKIRLKRLLLINPLHREKWNNKRIVDYFTTENYKSFAMMWIFEVLRNSILWNVFICLALVPALYCRQRRLWGSGSVKNNPEPPYWFICYKSFYTIFIRGALDIQPLSSNRLDTRLLFARYLAWPDTRYSDGYLPYSFFISRKNYLFVFSWINVRQYIWYLASYPVSGKTECRISGRLDIQCTPSMRKSST